MQIQKRLFPKEASSYLRERGVSRTPKTLAKLRCVGGGPLYHRIGRHIVYASDDLDAYIEKVTSPPYASTVGYRSA